MPSGPRGRRADRLRDWRRRRTSVGSNARLAAVVLGLSGFAALVHEIAWTRVLTMILGPTIYAFAAALAAVIIGIAIGSAVGTAALAGHGGRQAWLALVLAAAAAAGIWTSSLAGGPIPRLVAEQMATCAEPLQRAALSRRHC